MGPGSFPTTMARARAAARKGQSHIDPEIAVRLAEFDAIFGEKKYLNGPSPIISDPVFHIPYPPEVKKRSLAANALYLGLCFLFGLMCAALVYFVLKAMGQ